MPDAVIMADIVFTHASSWFANQLWWICGWSVKMCNLQMMSSDGFLSLQDRVFLDSVELKIPVPSVSSMSGNSSEPKVPPDSPGSSVSSRLQVEVQAKFEHVHTHWQLFQSSSGFSCYSVHGLYKSKNFRQTSVTTLQYFSVFFLLC